MYDVSVNLDIYDTVIVSIMVGYRDHFLLINYAHTSL